MAALKREWRCLATVLPVTPQKTEQTLPHEGLIGGGASTATAWPLTLGKLLQAGERVGAT